VDAGKPVHQRDRNADADMTHGHGGAGLFSDGKFSFFPSASELWRLPRSAALQAAYAWTCELLSSKGLDAPPFPSEPTAYSTQLGEWVLKTYPSDYLSLDARLELTAQLVDDLDATVVTEQKATSLKYDSEHDRFLCTFVDKAHREFHITTRRLIIAGGRFGALGIRGLTQHFGFRRLEVGFRIQQPAARAFFKDMKQLDPKLRFLESDGDVEWRTFCACRQGEAVLTETLGLWTVSGRADCPPTGHSNVGFNTRILDEQLASRVIGPALSAMANRESYFEVGLRALMAGAAEERAALDRVYGPQLREIMLRGLTRLSERFNEIVESETVLLGPTLEGVGWYPVVDGNLRLRDVPAWVAGDTCGLFRGIVAAMISGHYAATSALEDLESMS